MYVESPFGGAASSKRSSPCLRNGRAVSSAVGIRSSHRVSPAPLRGDDVCGSPGGHEKAETFVNSDGGGDAILQCVGGGTSVNHPALARGLSGHEREMLPVRKRIDSRAYPSRSSLRSVVETASSCGRVLAGFRTVRRGRTRLGPARFEFGHEVRPVAGPLGYSEGMCSKRTRSRWFVVLVSAGLCSSACGDSTADEDAGSDAGVSADLSVRDATISDASGPIDASADAGPDSGVCELPPPPVPDCTPSGSGLGAATSVSFTTFDPQDGQGPVVLPPECALEVFGVRAFTSSTSLNAALDCGTSTSSADVSRLNFATETLIVATEPNTASASALWVVDDGAEAHLGLEVAAYCGGAAPPGVQIWLVATTTQAVSSIAKGCQTGDSLSCCACEVVCDPTPRRTDCQCPP